MRKYSVLLLALLMVFAIHSGAIAAENDEFSTTSFRVDNNGETWYKSLNEAVSTNDTVTAAESGKVFLMNGDSVNETMMTLPACAAGLTYTFVSINPDAQKFKLNPNGTDKLVFSTSAAGNRIVSAGNIADAVTVISSDDTVWAVIPIQGTFTVETD